ncbi:MAG: tetratricopeptide repeat protein, partial [Gemmatimonadetes bacterium]|nr:tetratricopeptide repeat protein [Gemmatimonadota bacterium]
AGGTTIRCAAYATFGTQELSDAAIEALEEVARLQPDNSRAYYAMGIAYDRKGNPERAAEMYRLSREHTNK